MMAQFSWPVIWPRVLWYQRIITTDDDERMPPKGEPLSAEEVARVKEWIEDGAQWPENAADRAAAVDKRLQHWAVQPVRTNFDAAATIDTFIADTLTAKGLAMSPEADRRTLIRRLSFDLIGLPPTPERVAEFVRDGDPQAYEKLVAELLASPHYGERWARHWLDIAHYADTHGFERDQLRPNAWRYRDYVIESLNADKPYDQFVREQIAGDVLSPDDAKAIVATGFLAAGPWDFVGHVETKSPVLNRAARAGDLDDMVTQVITSTMGITINCARCHDHKLDPISQQEYYQLWSVFAGVKRGERAVSPAESKRLADEKVRINNALTQTRSQIAKLTGEGFVLASLIPKDSGIDLRNGAVTKEKLGYHRDLAPNKKVSVPSIESVVSVFIPNSPAPVPATSGHFWDTIANRPLNAQRSTTLGDTDFTSQGHSMLAMHANSGITFDLVRLREQSGLASMRLTGLVGFGASKEAAATRADFTVLVDTELKFQAQAAKRRDRHARC